jgi:hypothetical protein
MSWIIGTGNATTVTFYPLVAMIAISVTSKVIFDAIKYDFVMPAG